MSFLPLDALPNITQYREAWAERNSCNIGINLTSGALNPDVIASINTITHPHKDTNLRIADCSPVNIHAVMRGFTVVGLGHSWPSTTGLDGGTTTFNATTAEIIPFFDGHWLKTA